MRPVVLCAMAVSFFFAPGLLLPSGSSIEVEVEESVSVFVGIPGLELFGLVCFLDLFVAAVVAVASFSLFAGGTPCSAADSTCFGLHFFFLLLDSSFLLSTPTGGVELATFSGLSSASRLLTSWDDLSVLSCDDFNFALCIFSPFSIPQLSQRPGWNELESRLLPFVRRCPGVEWSLSALVPSSCPATMMMGWRP